MSLAENKSIRVHHLDWSRNKLSQMNWQPFSQLYLTNVAYNITYINFERYHPRILVFFPLLMLLLDAKFHPSLWWK